MPWKLQRLQGIRLALEGEESYRRIAAIVRVTATTLNQWINWYREGGIEGLLPRGLGAEGGKTPRFTPQQWERFREQTAKGGGGRPATRSAGCGRRRAWRSAGRRSIGTWESSGRG